MSARASRRGSRLLAELGVVFLGVFVALAADSFWQGQQEAARVDGYLRALEADASRARSSIQLRLEQTSSDSAQAAVWVGMLQGDLPAPDGATIGMIAWRNMPVVPRGAFEALLSTGDINLLDDSARAAIVAAYSELEPEMATLERLYELGATNVREHMLQLAELRDGDRFPIDGVPVAAARESGPVLAAVILHAGMLNNRRDALATMLTTLETLGGVVATGSR